MNRWHNKIAVVTGASAGIGAAVVKDLLKVNIIVVGLARRLPKIEKLRSQLPKEQQSRFYPLECDVSNEFEVMKSFQWIKSTLGGIDILINNAGVMKHGDLLTMSTDLIRETLNTNVMGIIYCTREAFNSMQMRNKYGHIIFMNSVAGIKIPPNLGNTVPSTNMYCPSKYCVTALADIYRQEFINLGTKIKITNIIPGLTATEMVPEFLLKNDQVVKLQPEDVSNVVMYALGTPENVQIRDIVVKAVGDQF